MNTKDGSGGDRYYNNTSWHQTNHKHNANDNSAPTSKQQIKCVELTLQQATYYTNEIFNNSKEIHDTFSDAKSYNQAKNKRNPNKQLLDTMVMFSQVTFNISREQAQKTNQ